MLDERLKTFKLYLPVKNVNESYEKLPDDLCPQIPPQALQTQNANSVGSSIDRKSNYSNDDYDDSDF